MNRREFIKNAVSAGVSICVASAIYSCEDYSTVSSPYTGIVAEIDLKDRAVINEDDYESLKKINRGVVLNFKDGALKKYSKANYGIPVVLLRHQDDKFVCFSAMCTHAQCLMTTPFVELPIGDYRNKPDLINDTYFN